VLQTLDSCVNRSRERNKSTARLWCSVGDASTTTTAHQVVHYSQTTFIDGVRIHRIEVVPVRIFEPAKTVADCFKYRNKIGLDIALEAL